MRRRQRDLNVFELLRCASVYVRVYTAGEARRVEGSSADMQSSPAAGRRDVGGAARPEFCKSPNPLQG